MKNQTQKRAFYVLTGCIVALALCIAAALALLCRTPAAQDVSIPGTRGTIYATVQLPASWPAAGICRWPCFATALRAARAGDGHFAPLAQELAAQGIATVRLDFPGCGDSTEPFTAYTLSNMTDDVESAILYMQSTYGTGRPRWSATAWAGGWPASTRSKRAASPRSCFGAPPTVPG